MFLGLASYRHLKTVRTHLATLVLPWYDIKLPIDIQDGLTSEVWERLKTDGLVGSSNKFMMFRRIRSLTSNLRYPNFDIKRYLASSNVFSTINNYQDTR